MNQGNKRPSYVEQKRPGQLYEGMTINPYAEGKYQSMSVNSPGMTRPPPVDYVSRQEGELQGHILDPSMAKMGPSISTVKNTVPLSRPSARPPPVKQAPSTSVVSTSSPVASASPPITSTSPLITSVLSPVVSTSSPVASASPPVVSTSPLVTSVLSLIASAPPPVVSTPPFVASTFITPNKSNALAHHHITGGKGWQRSFGYIRGTEVQPIQIIRPGIISAISFSHSGLGSVPSGSLFLCKNRNGDIAAPTEQDSSVVGIIRIKTELSQPTNFTLIPGESNNYATWESKIIDVVAKDCLSIYADNLAGVNIELYVEYH